MDTHHLTCGISFLPHSVNLILFTLLLVNLMVLLANIFAVFIEFKGNKNGLIDLALSLSWEVRSSQLHRNDAYNNTSRLRNSAENVSLLDFNIYIPHNRASGLRSGNFY